MAFTIQHQRHLRRHGFAVVDRFLSAAEVRAAREALRQYVPSAREAARYPRRYEAVLHEENHQKFEFPYAEQTLNRMATHPRVISMAQRLLGAQAVLLSRSAIWAKYAGGADYEQALHADWEGNTLVYPRDDGDYRQINIIIYYSDVTARLGPTTVVSQDHTRDLSVWPPFRYRREHPELYERERPVLVKAGAMLVFSMRTFHRGTAITAPHGARFTHHLVYRSARHGFQGAELWAGYGEKEELSQFLVQASPAQREVLGFPVVGDAYWNEQTLAGVAARYPSMDLRPYRRGTTSGFRRHATRR